MVIRSGHLGENGGDDGALESWEQAWSCTHCGGEHLISELSSVLDATARAFFCPVTPDSAALFRIVKEGETYRWDPTSWGHP